MSQPITIDNSQDADTVEIPLSEYEAVKAVASGIAKQNVLVQQQNIKTQEAIKTLSENVTALAGALKELTERLAVKEEIVIPAPVVHAPTPEALVASINALVEKLAGKETLVIPAPVVNFTPAEGKRKMTLKAKRDNKGFVTGFEGTTE